MGATASEITREFNRMEKLLSEAEATGKVLVHTECGDDYNPYPVFFTAEELIECIKNGEWHHVRWYLQEKKVMQEKILVRINELQKRLIRL